MYFRCWWFAIDSPNLILVAFIEFAGSSIVSWSTACSASDELGLVILFE